MKKGIHLAVPLLIASAALTSCNLPSETATQAAATVSGDLSDGEILQVMQTLNNGEISQAELALEKSSDEELQEAAALIIEDHSNTNQQIQSISQLQDLTLEESPLSRGLRLQADQIREGLGELSGQEFACAYLEKQVELHSLALETVRNDLQPDAESQDVSDLLVQSSPALEQHLAMAREALQDEQCA